MSLLEDKLSARQFQIARCTSARPLARYTTIRLEAASGYRGPGLPCPALPTHVRTHCPSHQTHPLRRLPLFLLTAILATSAMRSAARHSKRSGLPCSLQSHRCGSSDHPGGRIRTGGPSF